MRVQIEGDAVIAAKQLESQGNRCLSTFRRTESGEIVGIDLIVMTSGNAEILDEEARARVEALAYDAVSHGGEFPEGDGPLLFDEEPESQKCIDCGAPATGHYLCNRCFVMVKL